MSKYNENLYHNDDSAEVTYYPETTCKTSEKYCSHIYVRILLFILCMGTVSFFSIGIYKAYNETSKYTGYNCTEINDSTDNSAFELIDNKSNTNNAGKSILKISSYSQAITIPEIVKKVKPSVVGISCNFSESDSSTGTGIIISATGYIVTNAHVIQNLIGDKTVTPKNVTVVLSDKTEFNAEIIGADSRTDLAVIKINAAEKNLSVAEFGDSANLIEGELAVAIGNPLGFELYGSTTCGIISALNRKITIDEYEMTLIQTDAAINPGNSGGPLLNGGGQVIGINSSKIISTSAEGLGFAIPISMAKPIIDDLINNGYVTGRPMIGISGENIDNLTARYYDLPQGIYVRFIESNSAADKSGIEIGDIIVGVNGKTITTMSELNNEKDNFSSGDNITLQIYRKNNDENLEFTLKLDESKPK